MKLPLQWAFQSARHLSMFSFILIYPFDKQRSMGFACLLSWYANHVWDRSALTLCCYMIFNKRQVSRHKQHFFHKSGWASRNADPAGMGLLLCHRLLQVSRMLNMPDQTFSHLD